MTISVLLADDHAMFREGLKLLLEVQADIHIVGQAANGLEAVSMVKELNPRIVLMDISMPDLDGIGATGRIKSMFPKIKVLILSMYSTPEHIYRAFKAGADGYLLKESAGKEVIHAIRAIHTGGHYLGDSISSIMIKEYIWDREKTDRNNPLRLLSQREAEVLQLMAEGRTSKRIGEILYLAPSTVETYRHRIMKKLCIADLAGLIKFSIQQGLISLK